jgi:hypothetical protein
LRLQRLALSVLVVTAWFACVEKYTPSAPPGIALIAETGCVRCHSDSLLLEEVATPLPPDTGHTGEG